MAKSYEELLNMVMDYARRRKLDTTAQKNTQHRDHPMEVGAAHEHWDYNWDEEEIDAVGYYGYDGKGKCKGKGTGGVPGGSQCFTCGSTSHVAKTAPTKGQAKEKRKRKRRVSRSVLHLRRSGHPAKACPKQGNEGKENGKSVAVLAQDVLPLGSAFKIVTFGSIARSEKAIAVAARRC